MPNTTMETIYTEKTRLSERIAKIEIERSRLMTALAETEAAERFFEKYASSPMKGAKVAPKTLWSPSEGVPLTHKRGRPAKVLVPNIGTAATKTPAKRARNTGEITLGTAVYNVIGKYPGGAPVSVIMAGLKSEYGRTVLPNHLGIALKRHRIAGTLQEQDGRWYTPQALAQAA